MTTTPVPPPLGRVIWILVAVGVALGLLCAGAVVALDWLGATLALPDVG